MCWSLCAIMRKYQHYVKMPAYNPPGRGNCGYYALARAVGIFHRDAHQTVRNALLKELTAHRDNYLKLYGPATKRGREHDDIVQDQASVQLDVFVSRLQHTGLSAPPRNCFDTNMGFIVAQAYGRPLIFLGQDPGGCYTYLPYRLRPSPDPKPPIIIGFINYQHFVQFDREEASGKFECWFFFCTFLLTFLSCFYFRQCVTLSASYKRLGRSSKVCVEVEGSDSAGCGCVDHLVYGEGAGKIKGKRERE